MPKKMKIMSSWLPNITIKWWRREYPKVNEIIPEENVLHYNNWMTASEMRFPVSHHYLSLPVK